MASISNANNEDKKLLDLFDEGFSLFMSLQSCDEPTNSLNIQVCLKFFFGEML